MKRFLFVFLSITAVCQTAFAQEPVGNSDFKTLPEDSLPAILRPELSSLPSPFEMPSFMSDKTFEPENLEFPAIKKYSKLPSFKADDKLYNAMPRPYITPLPHDPYAYDFNKAGIVGSWRNGMAIGESHRTTMPGLMSRYNTSVTAVQNAGNFTFSGSLSADQYMLWHGTARTFGMSGAVTYHFNGNISATVFGRYYTNRSFYSMAAMPYFGTKGYGGYLTFMGESLGMDLGVERHYDAFARRWVTSPIITPKIKFSEKFTLDLPVGWLVKEVLDEKVFKSKRDAGPMIMPETGPMPGPIPFGTPEMPRGW